MNTIKTLFLIFVMVTMTSAMRAQQKHQDIIYLKDGSVIKGAIIELTLDKQIRIQSANGNFIICPMNEIEKYCNETVNKGKQGKLKPVNNDRLKRGYYGVIETGTGFNVGDFADAPVVRFNVINGYRVSPNFAAGGGIGFRYINEFGLFLPVFADLRLHFLDKKASPYISLGGGYSVCLAKNPKNSPFLSPAFGMHFRLENNKAINLGVSYEWQRMNYKYQDYYYNSYHECRRSLIVHAICFQFGISY